MPGGCRSSELGATPTARAAEIRDPVASLALLSLSLTCEALARDIEARAAWQTGNPQDATRH